MKFLKGLFYFFYELNSYAPLLIGLTILFLPCNVASQNLKYKAKHITVDDGLPQTSISDIIQDSSGYIWLATEDGLIRYDGYEFKSFQHELGDSTSIRGSFVQLIAEDKDGNIWAYLGWGLTDNMGLIDKLDIKTEKFIAADSLDNAVPANILDYFNNTEKNKKRKENLFGELAQLYPHDIEKKFQEYEPILKDAAGNFWIEDVTGLIFIEKNKKPFLTIRNEIPHSKLLNSNNIRTIVETNEGEVLVGFSVGGGFNHLDLNSLKIKKNPPITKMCWATAKGKENTYWLGGSDGNGDWLVNYNPQTGSYYFLSSKLDSVSKKKLNGVRSLTYDSIENLWIGTRELLSYNAQTNRLDIVKDFGKECGNINTISSSPYKW